MARSTRSSKPKSSFTSSEEFLKQAMGIAASLSQQTAEQTATRDARRLEVYQQAYAIADTTEQRVMLAAAYLSGGEPRR